jgi:hypothetical protein
MAGGAMIHVDFRGTIAQTLRIGHMLLFIVGFLFPGRDPL